MRPEKLLDPCIYVTVMSDIQPLDTWLATFSYSFLIASGNIAFDIFGIDSDLLMRFLGDQICLFPRDSLSFQHVPVSQ